MIVGLLCLAAVLLLAAGPIYWGAFYRSSVQEGNDADKLAAQFNSDWPTFVGKPEGSSTQPLWDARTLQGYEPRPGDIERLELRFKREYGDD